MQVYSITLKASAEREMKCLDNAMHKRVVEAVKSLAKTPRPHGVKKLKGDDDFWRIRVGNYRMLYTIDDKAKHIHIIRVGHRREVYD